MFVVGLCLATGVCVGVLDVLRSWIGLPPPNSSPLFDEDDDAPGVAKVQYYDLMNADS
jgi:hypothetical protein